MIDPFVPLVFDFKKSILDSENFLVHRILVKAIWSWKSNPNPSNTAKLVQKMCKKIIHGIEHNIFDHWISLTANKI